MSEAQRIADLERQLQDLQITLDGLNTGLGDVRHDVGTIRTDAQNLDRTVQGQAGTIADTQRQMAQRRMGSGKPGPSSHNVLAYFNGYREEDFGDWLLSFEDAAAAWKWVDNDKKDALPLYLRGPALTTYRGLQPNEKDSWAHLKDALNGKFGRATVQRYKANELQSRRQQPYETVEQYVDALNRLANGVYDPATPANIKEQNLYTIFLNGVSPDMQNVLLYSSAKTFEDAARVALDFEAQKHILNRTQPTYTCASLAGPIGVNSIQPYETTFPSGAPMATAKINGLPIANHQANNATISAHQKLREEIENLKMAIKNQKDKVRNRPPQGQRVIERPSVLRRTVRFAEPRTTVNRFVSKVPRQTSFTPQFDPNGSPLCHGCGKPGHFIRECPNNVAVATAASKPPPPTDMQRRYIPNAIKGQSINAIVLNDDTGEGDYEDEDAEYEVIEVDDLTSGSTIDVDALVAQNNALLECVGMMTQTSAKAHVCSLSFPAPPVQERVIIHEIMAHDGINMKTCNLHDTRITATIQTPSNLTPTQTDAAPSSAEGSAADDRNDVHRQTKNTSRSEEKHTLSPTDSTRKMTQKNEKLSMKNQIGTYENRNIAKNLLLPILVFNFMTMAHTYPMICQTKQSKTVWKIPEPPECNSISLIKGDDPLMKQPQVAHVMLYRKNIIQYQSSAWVCKILTREVRAYNDFFFRQKDHTDKIIEEAVTGDVCYKMVHAEECEFGPFKKAHDFFYTDNVLDWHYPGGGINYGWKQFKTSNCYKYKKLVYKTHGNPYMESTAGYVHHCNYTKGECQLKDKSYLLWDVDQHEKCEYTEWLTASGRRYGPHWVSDRGDVAFSFKNDRKGRDCEHNDVLISDQGIPFRFTYTQPAEVITQVQAAPRMISSSASVFGKYRDLIEKAASSGGRFRYDSTAPDNPFNRPRRSTKNLDDNSTLDLDSYATSGSVSLQLQALELNSAINNRYLFGQLVNSVCDSMLDVMKLSRATIQDSPILAVRNLVGSPYLYARSGGQHVEIWPCEKIYNYTLLPMGNGSCTQEIPIRYTLRRQMLTGFLDPVTNIIGTSALPISCGVAHEIPLHFEDRGDVLYDSGDGSLQPFDNAPTLAIFGWDFSNFTFPEIQTYYQLVTYNLTELRHGFSLNDLHDQIMKRNLIFEHIGFDLDPNGGDPRLQAENSINNLFNHGFLSFLYGIKVNPYTLWIFACCCYISMFAFIIHCCPKGMRRLANIGVPTVQHLMNRRDYNADDVEMQPLVAPPLPPPPITLLPPSRRGSQTSLASISVVAIPPFAKNVDSEESADELERLRKCTPFPSFTLPPPPPYQEGVLTIDTSTQYPVDLGTASLPPITPIPYDKHARHTEFQTIPYGPPVRVLSADEQILSSELVIQKTDFLWPDSVNRPRQIQYVGAVVGTVPSARIEILVNGVPTLALFDSGAGLTIVAERFLSKYNLEVIRTPWADLPILSVDKIPLPIKNTTELTITIGGMATQQLVYLADGDISHDVILGTDFMPKFGKITMDFDNKQLLIKNEVIPFMVDAYYEKNMQAVIVSAGTFVIYPDHEHIICGLMKNAKATGPNATACAAPRICDYYLEPMHGKLYSVGLKGAKELVRPNKDMLVPIRLVNQTRAPVVVHPNTRLYYAEALPESAQICTICVEGQAPPKPPRVNFQIDPKTGKYEAHFRREEEVLPPIDPRTGLVDDTRTLSRITHSSRSSSIYPDLGEERNAEREMQFDEPPKRLKIRVKKGLKAHFEQIAGTSTYNTHTAKPRKSKTHRHSMTDSQATSSHLPRPQSMYAAAPQPAHVCATVQWDEDEVKGQATGVSKLDLGKCNITDDQRDEL